MAFLAAAHLIGLGLAAWAVWVVIRRFGSADLAVQLLAAGVVVVLAAFALGTRASDLLTARDLSAVLPFGAALAGRLLPPRLARAKLMPAMGLLLACYLFSLGRIVALPPAPAPSADLAAWLAGHHLDLRAGRLLERQRHHPGHRRPGGAALRAGRRQPDRR